MQHVSQAVNSNDDDRCAAVQSLILPCLPLLHFAVASCGAGLTMLQNVTSNKLFLTHSLSNRLVSTYLLELLLWHSTLQAQLPATRVNLSRRRPAAAFNACMLSHTTLLCNLSASTSIAGLAVRPKCCSMSDIM